MSLVKRIIQVSFALDGDTFDGSNNTITVSGLRTHCTIQTYTGSIGSFANQMSMRIQGMKNADLAKLSTLGFSSGVYKKNLVTVSAGDEGSPLTQVFSGGITYGNVDYNATPDVGLDIIASALADLQFAPIAGTSGQGSVSVATLLQGIAAAANPPLSFVNNGVTAVLSNHAAACSALDQIEDICLAAGIYHSISNGTMTIWPLGKTIDSTMPIPVNVSTGMVGYPTYSFRGLDVKTLFNPAIQVGRQITVSSSTPAPAANAPQQNPGNNTPSPGANGTFYIWGVTHDLASEMINGPWFTTANLGNNNTSARA